MLNLAWYGQEFVGAVRTKIPFVGQVFFAKDRLWKVTFVKPILSRRIASHLQVEPME